jgi:hypothetical protein
MDEDQDVEQVREAKAAVCRRESYDPDDGRGYLAEPGKVVVDVDR